MADRKLSTTAEFPAPEGKGDIYNDTVGDPTQEQADDRSADYDPGVPGTATAADHDLSRRKEVAAATEIGDANGRIPSAQHTSNQLAVARSSQLPPTVEAASRARSAEPHPADHEEERERRRKSNYGVGYEKAFDAVPQRSYGEAGHAPRELSHERLESPGASGN